MPRKKGSKEDPVVQAGLTITLLSLIFAIAFASPFNPLPFAVSLVGLLAGLYIVAMRVYPKEAEALRKSLLEKIDFLFNWSTKVGKEAIEKTKKKIDERGERKVTEKGNKVKKYCRYCGVKNEIDAIFCEKCGKVIGEPRENN